MVIAGQDFSQKVYFDQEGKERLRRMAKLLFPDRQRMLSKTVDVALRVLEETRARPMATLMAMIEANALELEDGLEISWSGGAVKIQRSRE